jgi:hypothetical protein
MNSFWQNVFAGTLGAVLNAAAVAAIGELQHARRASACYARWLGYEPETVSLLNAFCTGRLASSGDWGRAGAHVRSGSRVNQGLLSESLGEP